MPTKSKWLDDQLVSVDGRRVAAALRFAGISNRQAAHALWRLDVRPTPQALDKLTKGRTKRARREVLRGIAKLAGPPITLGYLMGEEELQLPRKIERYAPGFELKGISEFLGDDPNPAPRAELEAARLSALIFQLLPRKERSLIETGLLDELGWLLRLEYWRDRVGLLQRPSEDERSNFAASLSSAIRLVLHDPSNGRMELKASWVNHFLQVMRLLRGTGTDWKATGISIKNLPKGRKKRRQTDARKKRE